MRPVRAIGLAVLVLVVTASCIRTGSLPAESSRPALPETPPQILPREGLSVMLVWHRHQPSYPADDQGVIEQPWVRLQAVGEYRRLVSTVNEFPDLRLTIAVSPVLLRSLEGVAEGARDRYWMLTEISADRLSGAERELVVGRFFDVDPVTLERFPRYGELAELRGTAQTGEGVAEVFGEQDLRDLQVLFNLAWIDPQLLATEPLSSLVDRGRDFTEEDKRVVLEEHRRIAAEVLSALTGLWEEGRIEVAATPYAQPVLPLLVDTDLALAGDPDALMPRERFQEVLDVTAHVQAGLRETELVLGRRPGGMWPAGGAVAREVFPLLAREGVEWVAAGEDVLARSLDMDSFARDAFGTVEEPEVLYRPWTVRTEQDRTTAIFFGDRDLSELVGSRYRESADEVAADQVLRHLARIRDRLDEQATEGPHVVTLVMGYGEPWEHRPGGEQFLRALYGRLLAADWLRTRTPSEYLGAVGAPDRELEQIRPGSWWGPDFALWIGEEEEAAAWDHLRRVRDDLAEAERSGIVHPDVVVGALDAMYRAQDSEWFRWYGEDLESGIDASLDRAFRELLGGVYDALGRDRPAFLGVPIVSQPDVQIEEAPEGMAEITVDNLISDREWAEGVRYGDEEPAGELLEAVWYGFDQERLFLRFDFAREVLGDVQAGVELYVAVPEPEGSERPITLRGSLLGFGATHLVEWVAQRPTEVCVSTALPTPEEETARHQCRTLPAGFDGRRVELAIPLRLLGPLAGGDGLRFRAVPTDRVRDLGVLPREGPGLMVVPEREEPDVPGLEP